MKKRWSICAVLYLMICLIGCGNIAERNKENVENKENAAGWEAAATTPYGKYPELVTYTLGKMTGGNNSNMPVGDTYEDNAYTRYLKNMLNVQNEDVFEAADNEYDDIVSMAIETNEMPDIMVVSTIEDVKRLADLDMIEDLSEAYEQCASERIKDIYNSYGEDFFKNVTKDDKMLAIPETNIEDGPLLLWIRKDWMDALNLDEPGNIDDVEHIITQFIEQDPGKNGEGNTVGIACDTNLVGESGYSYEYQMDVLFACFNAYPRQWLAHEDGTVSYGSVEPEVKDALVKLNDWYNKGIIDQQFLVRTTSNVIDLITEGKCGAFFGPWWAPNNPLMSATAADENAKWQPYVISTAEDGSVSYCKRNPSYKYVVVRKGYEHPELAIKILDVMYDYMRYEDSDAEEISKYYQMNVDMTARPLSINIDYYDALDRCYSDLEEALKGKRTEQDMELLEVAYFRSCKSYLENEEEASVEDWAAYTSRIVALGLIQKTKNNQIPTVYFPETPSMQNEWWKLKNLEQETFLKIVTGESDISAFDKFVTQWQAEGGERITQEVNSEIQQ